MMSSMKSLFELASLEMSNLDVAKYVGMFNSCSNPVEEVLEIRRKADRARLNKEFCSKKTRKKWWIHLSFFDEEDDSPRWIRFINGATLKIFTNGIGKLGKRKRTFKSKCREIIDYYGFKIVDNEVKFVNCFFDQTSYISLYEGDLRGHIRSLFNQDQEFLF